MRDLDEACSPRSIEDNMETLKALLGHMEDMMKNGTIYEVEYLEGIDGDSPRETAYSTKLRVLVGGDAEMAIEKARKHVLGKEPWEWEDDEGKTHTSKVTGFALVGVRELARADI